MEFTWNELRRNSNTLTCKVEEIEVWEQFPGVAVSIRLVTEFQSVNFECTVLVRSQWVKTGFTLLTYF